MQTTQDLMNDVLFFANSDNADRRKRFEDVFCETWELIPLEYRQDILDHLEFILCKNVEDAYQNGTPACCHICSISLKSFIIWNPYIGFLEQKTQVHVLAHELCHVYYNHPYTGFCFNDRKKEKVFIDTEAEPQAYKLTVDWGILPDEEDIFKLRGWRKYVLHEEGL